MPADLQSRSQYLVLAEFCQQVINCLSEYQAGHAELPREVLTSAVEALRSVKEGNLYKFGQKPAAALGGYEQLRTLEQVFRKPDQLDQAIELMAGILAPNACKNNDDQAFELIRLFTRLQTKALWNFEQPIPTAPPDIGELCRAFQAV